MPDNETDLWIQREQQCRIFRRSYEMWLDVLAPLRWLMLSGSTVLSLIAGATILTDPRAMGNNGHLIAGYCALAAGILSGLHSALKCEEFQTECRRLVAAYSGLEIAFQAIRRLDGEERRARENDLEKRYEETVTGAKAAIPNLIRNRAAREQRGYASI